MMKQSAEKTTSKNAVKTVIPSIWRTAGGKYSLIMLAIWLVVSAISLVWTPYSLLDTDGFNTWASPSGAHMLGTDGVGADVLSWLMAGSRTNLAIALLTVVVAAAIGLLLVAAMVSRHGALACGGCVDFHSNSADRLDAFRAVRRVGSGDHRRMRTCIRAEFGAYSTPRGHARRTF